MTLPKSIELRWQNEVIESWLNTPGIPSEAREELLAMQRTVREEMEECGDPDLNHQPIRNEV